MDSGPIVGIPDSPIDSLTLSLYRLSVDIHRQIVFSNDAYRSIADIYDKVCISIGSMLIRVQPMKFPFGNVETLYTPHTDTFRFLKELRLLQSKIFHQPLYLLSCYW